MSRMTVSIPTSPEGSVQYQVLLTLFLLELDLLVSIIRYAVTAPCLSATCLARYLLVGIRVAQQNNNGTRPIAGTAGNRCVRTLVNNSVFWKYASEQNLTKKHARTGTSHPKSLGGGSPAKKTHPFSSCRRWPHLIEYTPHSHPLHLFHDLTTVGSYTFALLESSFWPAFIISNTFPVNRSFSTLDYSSNASHSLNCLTQTHSLSLRRR